MKITFSQARLKALWAEAVQQWPVSVRTINGQRSPGFWLVGGQGVYLMHNGARPKGSPIVAYANECDPLKVPTENWLNIKRAIFGNGGGMEFIEVVMIGTAVDGGCDIEIMLDDDTMTVAVVENGQAIVRWQSLRTRLAPDWYH
ncbi:DUF3085 domain-containing protein [Bradyrhizobium sp. Tv2a-2]|uniref:DUF3085 domain-containing protein n=1 Tax=Bradyrhizobium sp. Tv2a-2 TaxID=113395 RepID=UPI0004665C68|nr:DUF3085 domain-containing protein [Bradyrhizobium sp. Tv2a-2]